MKKLERLRAFGRFLVDRGWWTENLALKLKRPKVKQAPTMPFTQDEMSALLAACEQYTDGTGKPVKRMPAACGPSSCLRGTPRCASAMLRVARWTGLSGNRLFLYTQKTGVPVYVPLPPFVVEALEACPRISERYWFWTGVGSKETLAGNWRRTFRRLCKIAGAQGATRTGSGTHWLWSCSWKACPSSVSPSAGALVGEDH